MEVDTYNLQRFTDAQAGSYDTALKELRSDRKRSHWMWYIFPQFRGLCQSSTARKFALRSLDEARAHLAHPVLGTRLAACTEAVLGLDGCTAEEIFGHPDVLKFRSIMTLFAQLAGFAFTRALDKYYGGEVDERTLQLLEEARA